MYPDFRRFGSYASSFLLLAAMLATLPFTGCGNMPPGSQPPSPTATWSPSPNDFRFQGVGAGLDATSWISLNVGLGQDAFNNTWGSPLLIGGSCVPSGGPEDCSWFFHTFKYAPGSARDTSAVYHGGYLTDLNNFPNLTEWGDNLSAPNLVIRSLDVEPANGVFAVAFISSPSAGTFAPSMQRMPTSNLQAFATSEGLQGRVVTALALDSATTAYVFSYGWINDTNSVYEASVAPVTLNTIASEAQNLASEGYILTAFGGGGTPTFGLYLVGTRIKGVATPRAILVFSPQTPSEDQYYAQGYVDVAFFLDPAFPTFSRIMEK